MSRLSVLDYRNGRFQGQIYKHRPHGIGAFFSLHLNLIFGSWKNGQLSGKSLIVNPNGSIFCGQIINNVLNGLCLYQMENDHIKLFIYSQQEQILKVAAIAPLYKHILEIDYKTSEILAEYQLKENDQGQNIEVILKIMKIPTAAATDFMSIYNYYTFFKQEFVNKYSDAFEQMKITSNGYLEEWIGFKEFGLGARIQPHSLSEDRIKTCQAYIVRQIGSMTRQNTLKGIGLKCVNHPLKGLSFQQGIFDQNDTKNIIQYKHGDKRPIKCQQIIRNELKRSLFFKNNYINTSYINKIAQLTQKIKKILFDEQIIKIAHFNIENVIDDPIILNQIQSKRMELSRKSQLYRKDHSPNLFNNGNIKPQSPDFNLQGIKKDIYRAVELKKQNQNVNVSYKELTSKHPHPEVIVFTNKSPEKMKKRPQNISRTKSRLTGSITPRKEKASTKKAQKEILQRSTSKSKIKDSWLQQQIKIIKPFPSPILKDKRKSKQKSNKKVTYTQMFQDRSSPTKRKTYQTDKKTTYSKPILRQNLFV